MYSDANSIVEYVKKKYHKVYTVSGMTKVLHRLGFVYRQTKSIPSKADEEAQSEFLKGTLPEILNKVNSGKAALY